MCFPSSQGPFLYGFNENWYIKPSFQKNEPSNFTKINLDFEITSLTAEKEYLYTFSNKNGELILYEKGQKILQFDNQLDWEKRKSLGFCLLGIGHTAVYQGKRIAQAAQEELLILDLKKMTLSKYRFFG